MCVKDQKPDIDNSGTSSVLAEWANQVIEIANNSERSAMFVLSYSVPPINRVIDLTIESKSGVVYLCFAAVCLLLTEWLSGQVTVREQCCLFALKPIRILNMKSRQLLPFCSQIQKCLAGTDFFAQHKCLIDAYKHTNRHILAAFRISKGFFLSAARTVYVAVLSWSVPPAIFKRTARVFKCSFKCVTW